MRTFYYLEKDQWSEEEINEDALKNEITHLDALTMKYPWSVNQWCELKSNPHYFLFVKKNQAQVLFHFNEADNTLHLIKISVSIKAQGSGVAKEIFINAAKQMKKLFPQIESIYLEVEEMNDRAMHFYLKMGFQKLNLIKKFYSDGANAWAMNRAADY